MTTPPGGGPQHDLLVTIRQDESCPATRLGVGPGVVRYLFDPSHDSKTTREPGQDFVALRHGADRVAFALCDGVGGSFLGHLAAQYLGTALVDWLWAFWEGDNPASRFQLELPRFLNDLVPGAREWIERYPLPAGLPSLLRDVLEERRAYGSETMFVCGHVAWPSPRMGGAIALATFGDSEIQVVDRSRRPTVLTGSKQERWSSHRGPRGQVKTHLLAARDVVRVLAYSDGLRSLASELHRLADDTLNRAVARLGQDPLSDDISLIDVALDSRDMAGEREPAGPAHTGRPPLTHPASERSDAGRDTRDGAPRAPRFVAPANHARIRRGAQLRWTAVPGARAYRVQQATTPDFDPHEVLDEEVRAPWLTVQERLPGSYCYRVRALLAGVESEWSPPLHVVIGDPGRHGDALP